MITYLSRLFNTSLSNMSMFDFVVAVLISIAVVFTAKWILKHLFGFCKSCRKVIYNTCHYSKIRCSHTQCPYCGRTLDKCTCAANQNLSYRNRMKAYKKRKKMRKGN